MQPYMATTGVSLALQIVSTTCDLDDRLDFRKLIPKTPAQRIAITTEDLVVVTAILESVRDLVLKYGTIKHKNEFHKLSKQCRSYDTRLEKSESLVKEYGKGWKAMLLLQGGDLKKLQKDVAEYRKIVNRASVRFRAELVDHGLVTIVVEEPSLPEQLEPQSSESSSMRITIDKLDSPTVGLSNEMSDEEYTRNQQDLVVVVNPFLNTAEHQCGDPLGAVTSVSSGQCSTE
ncbi:hypothetical protein C8R42DRAFT_686939 [Lentinula raphanica]|nr:hypothetical protein C8R42DRAFT_686939 [Lentinula raphanica]